MDLSKNFKLEDFISIQTISNYRRICVNILEPIRQRFGSVILDSEIEFSSAVRFKVHGYKNEIIADYIQESLIHSIVSHTDKWVYVECHPNA